MPLVVEGFELYQSWHKRDYLLLLLNRSLKNALMLQNYRDSIPSISLPDAIFRVAFKASNEGSVDNYEASPRNIEDFNKISCRVSPGQDFKYFFLPPLRISSSQESDTASSDYDKIAEDEGTPHTGFDFGSQPEVILENEGNLYNEAEKIVRKKLFSGDEADEDNRKKQFFSRGCRSSATGSFSHLPIGIHTHRCKNFLIPPSRKGELDEGESSVFWYTSNYQANTSMECRASSCVRSESGEPMFLEEEASRHASSERNCMCVSVLSSSSPSDGSEAAKISLNDEFSCRKDSFSDENAEFMIERCRSLSDFDLDRDSSATSNFLLSYSPSLCGRSFQLTTKSNLSSKFKQLQHDVSTTITQWTHSILNWTGVYNDTNISIIPNQPLHLLGRTYLFEVTGNDDRGLVTSKSSPFLLFSSVKNVCGDDYSTDLSVIAQRSACVTENESNIRGRNSRNKFGAQSVKRESESGRASPSSNITDTRRLIKDFLSEETPSGGHEDGYHRCSGGCSYFGLKSSNKEEVEVAFLLAFSNIVQMTYRTGFAPMYRCDGDDDSDKVWITIHSDVGWGCTIRAGQMLLVQCLQRHFLEKHTSLNMRGGACENFLEKQQNCDNLMRKSSSTRQNTGFVKDASSLKGNVKAGAFKISNNSTGFAFNRRNIISKDFSEFPVSLGCSSSLASPAYSPISEGCAMKSSAAEEEKVKKNAEKLGCMANWMKEKDFRTENLRPSRQEDILQLFLDVPCPSAYAPFSIFSFIRSTGGGAGWSRKLYGPLEAETVLFGDDLDFDNIVKRRGLGKFAGEWFGPTTVSLSIKLLVEQTAATMNEFFVYVNPDGFLNEVEIQKNCCNLPSVSHQSFKPFSSAEYNPPRICSKSSQNYDMKVATMGMSSSLNNESLNKSDVNMSNENSASAGCCCVCSSISPSNTSSWMTSKWRVVKKNMMYACNVSSSYNLVSYLGNASLEIDELSSWKQSLQCESLPFTEDFSCLDCKGEHLGRISSSFHFNEGEDEGLGDHLAEKKVMARKTEANCEDLAYLNEKLLPAELKGRQEESFLPLQGFGISAKDISDTEKWEGKNIENTKEIHDGSCNTSVLDLSSKSEKINGIGYYLLDSTHTTGGSNFTHSQANLYSRCGEIPWEFDEWEDLYDGCGEVDLQAQHKKKKEQICCFDNFALEPPASPRFSGCNRSIIPSLSCMLHYSKSCVSSSKSASPTANYGSNNAQVNKANFFPQESPGTNARWKRSLLLLFPMTLSSSDRINPIYIDSILAYLELPWSLGCIGGKTNQAFYYVGKQGDNLLYLDPHSNIQPPALSADADYASFFGAKPLKIPVSSMNPSFALAFYCEDEDDFSLFIEAISGIERRCEHAFIHIHYNEDMTKSVLPPVGCNEIERCSYSRVSEKDPKAEANGWGTPLTAASYLDEYETFSMVSDQAFSRYSQDWKNQEEFVEISEAV